MYKLIHKSFLPILTYDPLEVCGGVGISVSAEALPVLSYFVVSRTFPDVNLWAVGFEAPYH